MGNVGDLLDSPLQTYNKWVSQGQLYLFWGVYAIPLFLTLGLPTHTCFLRCPAMSFKLLRKLKCEKRRKGGRKERRDSLLLYICTEAGRHRQKCLWEGSWNLVGTSKTEKEWENYCYMMMEWVMYVWWCVCTMPSRKEKKWEREGVVDKPSKLI